MNSTEQIRGISQRLALAGWKELNESPHERVPYTPSVNLYAVRFGYFLEHQLAGRGERIRDSFGVALGGSTLMLSEVQACRKIACAFMLRICAEWVEGEPCQPS